MTSQRHDPPRPASSRQRSGPGLLESLFWVSGYHAAQLAAAVSLLLLLVLTAFEGWPRDSALLVQVADEFTASNSDWLLAAIMGCATLGALFLILPAALWRIGPSPRAALGGRLPKFQQIVLLTGAVLPLGILSDELYRVSSLIMGHFWRWLGDRLPVAAALDGSADTISLIQQQTASTAYPLLLVIVGLGPAIGEEVIFRGLIGRGLISRWGTLRGVLLTSVLFAAAHVSPAHAIATLPIAVFLHVAYLATGSLWAPIIVHFLNNALSITMLKYGLGQEVQVSLVLLISAAVYVAGTGALLLSGSTCGCG
ncbi:MAG: lysostaphin resistance A-like protein, partial [Planctomycetaceae bacterium]